MNAGNSSEKLAENSVGNSVGTLVGTLLCVDDDPTVLTALRALLGTLEPRHTIEIAQSGEEALEIAAELCAQGRPLAVVISDFKMPRMCGDELLIRLHALSPDTVKIMLTGQSDFDGVKRAINGADLYRFLEKPFNNDDFLLTIKSALTAFNRDRELAQQNLALRHLNTELETMLDRLKHQQEELTRSEAKATISTLVASVSHELSSPLGNSVLAAGMLTEVTTRMHDLLQSGQLKRSDLDNFVGTIEEGTTALTANLKRANKLLRNFKQVAADQASEQHRKFDLDVAIKEVVDAMAPSLRNKPHQIVLEIPTGISMTSQPGALGQVVINLINNACLHAFENRTDGVLTMTGEADGDAINLIISDNGVGMSKEVLTHLLEPFYSTKIGRGGTGLGMSIVDNLIRKTLGGTLSVRSTPGVGTSFEIRLPRTTLKANITHE
jgi:signal transduction histidine kinase